MQTILDRVRGLLGREGLGVKSGFPSKKFQAKLLMSIQVSISFLPWYASRFSIHWSPSGVPSRIYQVEIDSRLVSVLGDRGGC